MNKPRFGIAGAGYIAMRHAQAIKEVGGEVAQVCDKNQEKLDAFLWKLTKMGLPAPKTTKSYWEMEDIDFVAICSPNHLHAHMIRYFSPKGVKVIVEKPPVIRAIDFENLKDHDINVMLQLRYHPEMRRLQELAKTTQHGGCMTIRMKRDDSYWKTWKGDKLKSGGLLFNIGIHYLDAILHCFEGEASVDDGIFSDHMAIFRLKVGKHSFHVHIQLTPTSENQTREIFVGGECFQFSKQDNLSLEDLHTTAYRDILSGGGIKLKDCERVMNLLFSTCK